MDSGLVQLQVLATDDPKGFGPTSEVFLEGSMQGPKAGPWLLVCSSWDEQASVATAEPLDYDEVHDLSHQATMKTTWTPSL